MPQIKNVATGVVYTVSANPVWSPSGLNGLWVCGDQNFVDPDGTAFEVVSSNYQTLTPMQFYMAFTPAERIAIKKSTDPIIEEFWDTYQLAAQLNNVVDPNLASIVEGLDYMAATNVSPAPAPAWTASMAVAVGQKVAVGTNVYTATTAGATGSTAPSGTGAAITDGTAVWAYTPTPYLASTARIAQIQAGLAQ